MSEMEEFLGRVRGLVISLHGILTTEECSEVDHLIDHGELGEAMRTLAWTIVNGEKKVPREVIESIRDFSSGLVDPSHMPPNLDDHVIGP